MRPHKLVMKAFGPFGKETTVDFDKMGNNIYLISGPTGSGKTTIFDGIVYALYGTASGDARSSIGTEGLHSDYAKNNGRREEMRVELSFSEGSREYTVTRSMMWGKRGESMTAAKESALYENGSAIVRGKGKESKDDVTLKITEILGLDAEQFRKIIMLAQGEFQKFLTSRSDERGDILGKLCDNRRQQDLQQRLKAAYNRMKEMDKGLVETGKAQLGLVQLPNDGEDYSDRLIVDHPELKETLEKVLSALREEMDKAKEEIETEESLLKKLEKQRTQGETVNGLLDELDKKKLVFAALEGGDGAMTLLRGQIEAAEAALKVLPYENTLNSEKRSLTALIASIAELENTVTALTDEEQKLSVDYETEKTETEVKIGALGKRKAAIQEKLHIYDELNEGRAEQSSCKKQLADAKTAADNGTAELEQLKNSLNSLNNRQKELENAGAAAVLAAERRVNDLSDRKSKLLGIKSGIAIIKKLIGEESKLASECRAAQNKELQTERAHLRLNEALISGQAGFLAEEMRKQLEEKPEVCCPVCGVTHTKENVHGFARPQEDTPTREDVDKAYELWDETRKAAREAERKHADKKNDLDTKMRSLLDSSAELISVSDWNELTTGEKPETAITQCKAELKLAEAEYAAAVAEKTEKESLSSEKEKLEITLNDAEKRLEEAKRELVVREKAAVAANTSVENWEKQLQGYPESKKAAEKEIDGLTNNITGIQQHLEETHKRLQNLGRELAVKKGERASKQAEKTDREETLRKAETALRLQLEKNGFETVEAYNTARSPLGYPLEEERLTGWCKAGREKTEKHEKDKLEAKTAIDTLRKSTEGMVRADLEGLKLEINASKEKLKKLRGSESNLTAAVDTDSSVLKEVSDILRQRKRLELAAAKLNPLYETADGKYPFSRYVLGGFFKRVVEQANRHLDIMTDGEYRLVHKEQSDGRALAGLELKVLNTITNQERETGSLSGGQSFEASLALALGLSDMVQLESTSKIQIDSMFIDEGFGSLDSLHLDKAMTVLGQLTQGRRQIGIISHVAELNEIPKKIVVRPNDERKGTGSSIECVTDE